MVAPGRIIVCLGIALVGLLSCGAAAENGADSTQSQLPTPANEIGFGGRFEFRLQLDEQSNPFPWNASTHAATDLSRFMVDFRALTKRYGSLYLKGAAFWGLVGSDDTRKRFRFEQGDYLWAHDLTHFGYSVRIFANERRFFVSDLIAPLIADDLAGETGANGGVRIDAATNNGWDATALYSLLADDVDTAPAVSYLRAAFSRRLGTISASYLIETPGSRGVDNHAIVKAELITGYKNAFVVLAYQQSGYRESGWFFPSGKWNWGEYDGTNFSAVLPAGGAAFGEARLTSLRWNGVGSFRLVWRYEAVREEFVNHLGLPGTSRVGHTGGAYFVAEKASLNARLRYIKGTRSVLETEDNDAVEASAWAALKNNMECFLRGGLGRIDDGFIYDTKKNYIHAAVRYRVTRFLAGAHVMWKDLETVYSERRFAFDGKLAINPNWGFHWRFIMRKDFQVGQASIFRIEFRPNQRIFAYLGYGREYYGDNPFVLEDRDIGLTRSLAGRWVVMLRGDF
ncbi:MAG: hypothetical protein JSW50_09255 [Candidatus Latescibacterota bacterium]|nr:MAG: hypothetical protein JSW50_09255 [Candidatus Latescibacterota bacterium]